MGNLHFHISIPKLRTRAPFSLILSYRPLPSIIRNMLRYNSVLSYIVKFQMVPFWTQNWHLYKYDTTEVCVETVG